MGSFASLLTVAFIVLKLVGVIGWSWFLVLLPLILYIALQLFLFVLLVAFEVYRNLKNH
jgi:ATP/ADP translocase